ncbi:hypothetical protein [Corynebacterium pyruviciproducens]|nr:hypothetical protein [Corynebacterium pyruviciproducens]MDK7213424.1 hypothetical protein [Corynebacterium pyruviciproducens]
MTRLNIAASNAAAFLLGIALVLTIFGAPLFTPAPTSAPTITGPGSCL